MKEAFKRTGRTFLQAFLGVVVLQAGALVLDANDGSLDASLWRRVVVTALVAGVIAAVTFLHNFLEDKTPLPAILK